jgi:hypothetical protein
MRFEKLGLELDNCGQKTKNNHRVASVAYGYMTAQAICDDERHLHAKRSFVQKLIAQLKRDIMRFKIVKRLANKEKAAIFISLVQAAHRREPSMVWCSWRTSLCCTGACGYEPGTPVVRRTLPRLLDAWMLAGSGVPGKIPDPSAWMFAVRRQPRGIPGSCRGVGDAAVPGHIQATGQRNVIAKEAFAVHKRATSI